MSTILVVPKAVFIVTLAGCLSVTVPMMADSRPSGWFRMAASTASAHSGRDDGDKLAFVSDIQRIEAEQFAGAADDLADGNGGSR